MKKIMEEREAERKDGSFGKPKIGGPFEMVDCESGKSVTNEDFKGKFTVLYFGFTHCPDVCPDELEKMSKVITKIDQFPDIGPHVVPIFISVDPGRDSPEVVKKYIKEFHPRFRGLTGSQEQVDAVAKTFRIYISRGESSPGDDNDYLVDHSIFFFLMDPEGTFLDFFGRNATSDDISVKIMQQVREWQKHKQAGRL
jgi:protein SCO1